MSSISDFLLSDWDSDGTSLNDIFEDQPCSLDVFTNDSRFLMKQTLSEIQYEAVRHIERIYFPDLYPRMAKEFNDPYWAEPVRMVNYVTLQWGKGAGKDHVCRVASLRIAYLLLCLKSPQTYFDLAEQDFFHILNVAPTAGNASTAFFKPLLEAIRKPKTWFSGKCRITEGKGLVTWDKNVLMISGHADTSSQEGMNLIAGFVDEVDEFKADEEIKAQSSRLRKPTKTGEAIVKMIDSSGRSRFDTFKRVMISYPRYEGSTIQTATKEARDNIELKGDKSPYYVSGPHASWEVNPRYKKQKWVKVPGTDLEVPENLLEDYEKDILEARSKYECMPSRAHSPYFRNTTAIENIFYPVVRDPIEVNYRLVNNPNSVNDGVDWQVDWDIDESQLYPIAGAAYVMHGDLSISGDRAGIAMAHCIGEEVTQEKATNSVGEEISIPRYQKKVKVDFILSLTSDKTTKPVAREIQVQWAVDLAYLLVKRGFRIVKYTFDKFASQALMQDLQRNGIPSSNVSTDRDDSAWKNLRDLMYSGRITVPYYELLKQELEALTKLENGKIDHPPHFSKDAADAVACAALGAVIVGGQESETKERVYFEAPTFQLGKVFDLPLAIRHITPETFSPLPYRPDTL